MLRWDPMDRPGLLQAQYMGHCLVQEITWLKCWKDQKWLNSEYADTYMKQRMLSYDIVFPDRTNRDEQMRFLFDNEVGPWGEDVDDVIVGG